MARLLFWLTGFLPLRVIDHNYEDGRGRVVYLERYYVGTLLGLRFYIHRFVGSDPDRGLHDHPWPWAVSLVLSGWYDEWTRRGLRKVRWFNFITGDTFHRVVLPVTRLGHDGFETAEAWTFFFHPVGHQKEWGFLRDLDEDQNESGAKLYIPFDYSKTTSEHSSGWWTRVPKGREHPRRAPGDHERHAGYAAEQPLSMPQWRVEAAKREKFVIAMLVMLLVGIVVAAIAITVYAWDKVPV